MSPFSQAPDPQSGHDAPALPPTAPLVVFGAASERYDFGPGHPLTPRRFGPGIDLLRTVGATRFEEPVVASDDALVRIHDRAYVLLVRQASADGGAQSVVGIVPWGDTPPFRGMHEAAAIVAGGSLVAIERILAGTALRAFHPGGGLHHGMPGHASGFCIYNDVALAIRRARDAGERVMYVDLDVHHGDGVEAAFWNDPGVLTVSIHETGLVLFPGSGFVEDRGGPHAHGSAVNLPLEPGTSDGSWLESVELLVPPLAAAFHPTILVTQHGSDSHALDPLGHLRITTRAMRSAALLLDRIAHEHAGGRWLATGGGGYDVYRVVPRAWALVWLAQAHRDPAEETPAAWRVRWTAEAARYRQAPVPAPMLDPDGLAEPETGEVRDRNLATARDALGVAERVLKGADAA